MRRFILKSFWRQFSPLFVAIMLMAGPVHAQIETVDPNDVIGTDVPDSLPDVNIDPQLPVENPLPNVSDPSLPEYPEATYPDTSTIPEANPDGTISDPANPNGTINDETTYQQDDLIGAAEGVFGKGAEGIAKLIQDILKDQGQPNGYIVGREAGGAFVVGLRYGSGTLYHKVEGEMPVYWTGPSIGFDAGGNAGSTFILVYNLYDTEDLYTRFPSAEGVAYLIGGFNASYLRSGDRVLIPIRVGAGLRLGANVGYMKMTKKRRWLPF